MIGTLLVISGPVGIGKSTAAIQTARELRKRGMPTSILDLDEIYRMLRQEEGFDNQDTWRHARQAAANLAAFAFHRIAKVVIVEGSFHTEAELLDLTSGQNVSHRVVLVSLCAPFSEVHKRVMNDADPRRVASKIPAFLEQLYAEFEAALPYLRCRGHCLDVGNLSVGQVGTELASLVVSADANAEISHSQRLPT